MEIVKTIFSKRFAIHLGIMILIALLGIFILNTWLKSYTEFGQSYTVPDLRGLTYQEAVEQYEDLPFAYLINDSSDYFAELKPFEIIDQNPVEGKQVKQGRTIYLSVNKTSPGQTEIPDVVDRHYVQAQFILERKDLLIDTLIYVEHPFKNLVLDVLLDGESVEPGTRVVQQTEVSLVLGDGIGATEELVPCLTDLTFAEATFIVQSNYFSLGNMIFDGEITDTATAVVYLQEPECDSVSKLRIGEPIDLFLRQDREWMTDQKPDSAVQEE